MQSFKTPKDNEKYHWTQHVIRKMGYYALTPSRVLRVIRAPERTEEGVAPGTLASMQTAGSKAKPWEIWVMWRAENAKQRSKAIENMPLSARKIVITAWRYPGVSSKRERVPLPAGVLAELEEEGVL